MWETNNTLYQNNVKKWCYAQNDHVLYCIVDIATGINNWIDKQYDDKTVRFMGQNNILNGIGNIVIFYIYAFLAKPVKL